MLIIKECIGYELVKEKPTSPQDNFNSSLVTYIEDGREKTLHVLYVKYFEELLAEQEGLNPICKVGEREVYIKDVAALICLLQDTTYKDRKRVYISSQKVFSEIFENIDVDQVKSIFQGLEEQQTYTV